MTKHMRILNTLLNVSLIIFALMALAALISGAEQLLLSMPPWLQKLTIITAMISGSYLVAKPWPWKWTT